jgi:acyl carrier protein
MTTPSKTTLPGTTMDKQIENAIYSAIDQVNQHLPAAMTLSKSPSQPLMGTGSKLDSIALVNLIVAVEQSLQDLLGVPLSLVDERAFSMTRSPFRDVESLGLYIQELMNERTSPA